MKILLIEDDRYVAAYVVDGLTEEGHVVAVERTSRDALLRADKEEWDLLIVDRMIPGRDGLSVVKALRARGLKTPVLFLTTKSGVGDRVEGLNAGGDDYLVKPFALVELAARVQALGRRPPELTMATVLRVGDLEMDLVHRTVRRRGQKILLQPREYRLLEYLMRHAGEVVTRSMLLENVWDYHFDTRTNLVETHMSRLRSKLSSNGEGGLIHTVRGAGYSLHAPT